MAGLASLWKRGRTIGDLTGGGGRSIMPTRRRGSEHHILSDRLRDIRDRQGLYPQSTGTGVVVVPPPGGKHGGLLGYRNGGRTMNPRAAGAAAMRRNRPSPYRPLPFRPGGWQEGGPVGVAPEEVAMAAEIYARATPEQQAQITGGGGGPGMMDEEAAIGEALAMAMGGGGPPMEGGPPMGGMI